MPEKRRKRRKKIILQSVVIAFVLVFTWIGVLIGLQMVARGDYRFRLEVTEVMEMIRDGREEELYDLASPRFQDTMVKARFVALCDRITQTFGEFKKVASTYDPVTTSGPQGKTGHVVVSMEFSGGKATGSFSFHHWEGQWRLLGLYIEVPEEITRKVAGAEERKVKGEASGEVLDLMTSIFQRASAGEGAEIHAEAAELFKRTVSRDRFLEILAKQKESLGTFVRVLFITHTWQSDDRVRANVVAVLEFDKSGDPKRPEIVRTEGRLEFKKEGVTWKLAKFKVVMPEPEIPRRPTAGPIIQ